MSVIDADINHSFFHRIKCFIYTAFHQYFGIQSLINNKGT